MSIFISHASADKNFVRELVAYLRRLGRIVWFDEDELRPGNELDAVFRQNIETADWFILVASRNSARSHWVARELRHARSEEGERKALGILVARLDDAEWPGPIGAEVTVDCTTDVDGGLEEVRYALEQHQIMHVQASDSGRIVESYSRRGLPFSPRPSRHTSFRLATPGYHSTGLVVTEGEGDVAARATSACTHSLLETLKTLVTGSPVGDFRAICLLFNQVLKDQWRAERGDDRPNIGAKLGMIFVCAEEVMYLSIGRIHACHYCPSLFPPVIRPIAGSCGFNLDHFRRDSFVSAIDAPLGQAEEIIEGQPGIVPASGEPSAFLMSDFEVPRSFAEICTEIRDPEPLNKSSFCRYLTMVPLVGRRGRHVDPNLVAIWSGDIFAPPS